MLLIRATAGPSKIHGYGLIAREFISKGSLIWKFQSGFDLEIPESQLSQLSNTSRDQVEYYAYFHEATRTYILSSDDDRFTNHSDDPNAVIQENCTVAVRDIVVGEEITCDYGQFSSLNYR